MSGAGRPATHLNVGSVPDRSEPAMPTAVQELVLNPLLNVVVASRDEVLVKYGIRSRFSHVLLDEKRSGSLGRVVRAFERARKDGRPVAELVADIDTEALDDAVEFLREREVLVEAGRDPTRLEMDLLFGEQAPQERVFLLGAGSHAAEVTRHLDRLPIGSVGSIAESALADANGGGPDESLERFAESDDALLVVALDGFRPALLHRVNEVMLELGSRWMLSIVEGPLAIIGPVFQPHEGPCYAEFEIQFESTVALRDEYLMQKEQLVQGDRDPVTCSPLSSGMGAAWTANWVVHALQGSTGFNPAQALFLDYRELNLDWVEVLKLPRCPACNWGSPSYPRHLLL
jgi:bacteriocin biosynthesis cyclodehydratase domain-containing protein